MNGDSTMKALVYHGPGNCALEYKPKPIIQNPTDAIVRITKTGIADPTQFDRKSKYYDADANPAEPRWMTIEIGLERAFPKPVPLPDLRGTRGLENMVLLRRGSRLSVQPVTDKEWKIVMRMGGL